MTDEEIATRASSLVGAPVTCRCGVVDDTPVVRFYCGGVATEFSAFLLHQLGDQAPNEVSHEIKRVMLGPSK